MREGFTFCTARVLALASLGAWPTYRGMLPASAACAAPPSPGHVAEIDPQDSTHHGVLAVLNDLWGLAWDAEFVLNESGIGLKPTPMPGAWSATVYRQNRPIAEGSYDEIVRLAAPEIGSWNDHLPADLLTVELFITAGVLHGTTGLPIPTWGLVRRVASTGPAPLVVEGFTPLGAAGDLALAVAGAVNLLSTLSGWSNQDDDRPPYTYELCQCEEIYDNELGACLATAIGCHLLCASGALGGIVACLALGPLAPACMAVILAAEAACIASCIMKQQACQLRAVNNLIRCRQACKDRGLP
jgi:hypothetical protein